jgi:phage-related minor tail protein
MAGSIKGITIEINGDTSKLSSALRQADSAIKETQSQLNAVEKSLKFDPGNVDLLRDKYRLMGDRITETKDRLKTLEEAQRQMDASGVDKNSGQYKALQTEIDTTKSKVKGLEGQMKDFGSVGAQKMAAVGEAVKQVGDKIKAVGEGMTKYITGPIVAVGAASMAAFNEVDEGMDIMIQKTGATGQAAEELQGIMENIATTIPTDFATAG